MSVVQICGAEESLRTPPRRNYAEDQQIAAELKKHQATQHSPILTAKTLAIQSSRNRKEEIRHRAYELYEERGREDGHDLDDWLRAEAEITAKNAKTAAA